MSYSFSITADTKEDATRQIREQFDNVVAGQPSHVADKEAVIVAAQNLVRLLDEPTQDDEIFVSMNGSLSWRQVTDPVRFLGASVTINAALRAKG